jgi:hypothetical protein
MEPPAGVRAKLLLAGYSHACATDAKNKLFCWGNNLCQQARMGFAIQGGGGVVPCWLRVGLCPPSTPKPLNLTGDCPQGCGTRCVCGGVSALHLRRNERRRGAVLGERMAAFPLPLVLAAFCSPCAAFNEWQVAVPTSNTA